MISLSERLAACAAGAAGAFYALAAIVALWRIAARRKRVDRIMVDRAFAWTGLVGLFTTLALDTLDLLTWAPDWTAIAYASSSVVVLVAGLFSVRAITVANGVGALMLFCLVSAAAAVALWTWG